MKTRQVLLFFVFLTVFFFGMGHVWAEEIIKLAVGTIPGKAQNICADEFRKLLENRSNYKVRPYQGSSLGTETDILKKIRADEVQMGVITSAPFDAFLPDVHVLDYPFLFANYDQVDMLLNGVHGQELLKRLEKAGFKGLAYAENGFRNLTNNRRSVHRVEDVAGLKIRVMESAVHRELWKMLGAIPVSIGWPGVVTALKEKSVVTPVKTGVQILCKHMKYLDSVFRRNNKSESFSTFYEFIIVNNNNNCETLSIQNG